MKRISKIQKLAALQENVKLRLPRDYPWKMLGWLTDDLQHLLGPTDTKRITRIIRQRDFESYLKLSEEWSLQSIDSYRMSLAEVRAKYQVACLLKKFKFDTNKELRVSNALEKFRAAEVQCFEFNTAGFKKLSWSEDNWMININTYMLSFVRKVLGDFPEPNELALRSRHGVGSTLDTSDGRNSSYDKFDAWPYDCTLLALPHAISRIKSDQRWLGALEDDYRTVHNIERHVILDQEQFWSNVFNIVPGNRITFVPKSSITERTIAIEPTLNVFLQLGVDGFIRRRLKRWGVDLDDQSKNQELARRGSMPNSQENFVTLDMSAASDTISLGVVKALLPPAWYDHLYDLRCHQGILGDEVISYEKFSSMGNGYTFALESLLFSAVVYAVMKEELGTYDPTLCAVYGDDIIVPRMISDKVVLALENCGFSINTEKSFFEGPFRESCGADWFNGSPIRPIFLTETPTTVPALFNDFNRIKRLLHLRWGIAQEQSKVLGLLHRWVPEQFRLLVGPLSDETFDSYLHSQYPLQGMKYFGSTWHFKHLIIKPIRQKGRNFLFRKLMHNLPGTAVALKSYKKPTMLAKALGAGSRFTITRRNAMIVAYTYTTSEWTQTYSDQRSKIRECYLKVAI